MKALREKMSSFVKQESAGPNYQDIANPTANPTEIDATEASPSCSTVDIPILAEELIMEIMKFCDVNTLVNMERVSKHFQSMTNSAFRNLVIFNPVIKDTLIITQKQLEDDNLQKMLSCQRQLMKCSDKLRVIEAKDSFVEFCLNSKEFSKQLAQQCPNIEQFNAISRDRRKYALNLLNYAQYCDNGAKLKHVVVYDDQHKMTKLLDCCVNLTALTFHCKEKFNWLVSYFDKKAEAGQTIAIKQITIKMEFVLRDQDLMSKENLLKFLNCFPQLTLVEFEVQPFNNTNVIADQINLIKKVGEQITNSSLKVVWKYNQIYQLIVCSKYITHLKAYAEDINTINLTNCVEMDLTINRASLALLRKTIKAPKLTRLSLNLNNNCNVEVIKLIKKIGGQLTHLKFDWFSFKTEQLVDVLIEKCSNLTDLAVNCHFNDEEAVNKLVDVRANVKKLYSLKRLRTLHFYVISE